MGQPAAMPRRPALRLPLPKSPYGPASADLGILVSAAIKACPQSHRNAEDFHLCTNTTNNPVAPPPTPVSEALLTPSGWTLKEYDDGAGKIGLSPGELASGATTPRTSGESKRVTFSEEVTDVDAELESLKAIRDEHER